MKSSQLVLLRNLNPKTNNHFATMGISNKGTRRHLYFHPFRRLRKASVHLISLFTPKNMGLNPLPQLFAHFPENEREFMLIHFITWCDLGGTLKGNQVAFVGHSGPSREASVHTKVRCWINFQNWMDHAETLHGGVAVRSPPWSRCRSKMVFF